MSDSVTLEVALLAAKTALFESLSEISGSDYKIDIIIDDNSCFRAIIDFEKCIGELIIEKQNYTPYRYICFNILSSITELPFSIFFWSDSENDSFETIKNNISEGVKAAANY